MPSNYEEALKELSHAIEEANNAIHGKKMGFALFLFELNKPGDVNYLSNGKREDMIRAMRETLARFETQTDSKELTDLTH